MSSPTAPGGSRRALVLVAASIPLVTGLLWLESDRMLSPYPGFMPAFLALVLACHLMTSTMLVEHYRAGAGPRLLALSAAYVWSEVCVVAFGLAFPDVIAPRGVLGGVEATAPWLWLGWNIGFPVLVAAALAPWPAGLRRWLSRPDHRARRTLLVHAGTAAAALLFVLLAVKGVHLLPDMMSGGDYSGFAHSWGYLFIGINVLALVVAVVGVTLRGDRGGLETWAVVAVIASCADSFLVLTGSQRYTVGWYSARALALTAAVVVLLAMLREVTFLYRQVTLDAALLQQHNTALEEAHKLREHMIAVVSHDMRTPLAGLEGYLEVLEEPGVRPGDVAHMVARSQLLTRRLTLMTEDLLAVATASNGDLSISATRLDVADALAECTSGFPDLDVRTSTEPGLVVHADPLRLQQVLANLVRNAQNYGREPVTLEAHEEPGTVVFNVSDAGDGVPAEFVPHLFESYTRAVGNAVHGSGLGLSVVRALVTAHGGSVSYLPESNTFRVRLPAGGSARVEDAASLDVVVSE